MKFRDVSTTTIHSLIKKIRKVSNSIDPIAKLDEGYQKENTGLINKLE